MEVIKKLPKTREIRKLLDNSEQLPEFKEHDTLTQGLELYSHNDYYPFTIRSYYDFQANTYIIVYWYYPEGEPGYSGKTKPRIMYHFSSDDYREMVKTMNKIFFLATEQFI